MPPATVPRMHKVSSLTERQKRQIHALPACLHELSGPRRGTSDRYLYVQHRQGVQVTIALAIRKPMELKRV